VVVGQDAQLEEASIYLAQLWGLSVFTSRQSLCFFSFEDNTKSRPKWRKCESFRGNGLRAWRLEQAMDRMDQPRTSIDERMLSGRRAVVIV